MLVNGKKQRYRPTGRKITCKRLSEPAKPGYEIVIKKRLPESGARKADWHRCLQG